MRDSQSCGGGRASGSDTDPCHLQGKRKELCEGPNREPGLNSLENSRVGIGSSYGREIITWKGTTVCFQQPYTMLSN